jgi:ketosteroid isomerase-like protein
MVHPNVEMMRNYLEAWKNGDVEKAMSFWDDDVVLHMFGRNPYAGTYTGREDYKNYVMTLYTSIVKKAELLKIYGNLADDERAVNLIRVRFERDGKEPLEIDRTTVFRLRNGKIMEESVFDDDQYAVDDFFS